VVHGTSYGRTAVAVRSSIHDNAANQSHFTTLEDPTVNTPARTEALLIAMQYIGKRETEHHMEEQP
jgi:hypothetical protein